MDIQGETKPQHGTVCAGDRHTAQAGAEMLALGGNAIDATLAATFTSFVSEPGLTSPFGGGFATICGPKMEPQAFNFFANAPGLGLNLENIAEQCDFTGVEVSFGPTTQTFHIGRGSTALPLVLPGLLHLHQRYARLSLAQIVQPAIDLAQKGVRLSEQVVWVLGMLEPILRFTPPSEKLVAPSGELIRPGERYNNPELSHLLKNLAETGNTNYYDQILVEHFGRPHGLLTKEDFKAIKINQSKPIHIQIRQYDVYLNPPPTAGGLLIGFGLRLLENINPEIWTDELLCMKHLAAALAITVKARSSYLDGALAKASTSDDFNAISECFLSDEHIKSWQNDFNHALYNGVDVPVPEPSNTGNTTHISVIDNQGWACSMTTSNGEGCGYLVPGTGSLANNFMGEEDIHPQGFFKVQAGSRLGSMMCPTLVLEHGKPILALGTGGSNRIRTAILQVLVHHLLGKKSLGQSVHQPRMHFENNTLYLEKEGFGQSYKASTISALKNMVHQCVLFDAPNMFFGGVHAAAAHNIGAGDKRRGGSVATT